MSAGARFTVIRLIGNSYPQFFIEALTRSLDSFTAVSGKPTISNDGIPLERSVSTSTRIRIIFIEIDLYSPLI